MTEEQRAKQVTSSLSLDPWALAQEAGTVAQPADHVLTPTSVRQGGAPGSKRPGFFTPSVLFLLGDSLDSAPQ